MSRRRREAVPVLPTVKALRVAPLRLLERLSVVARAGES